MSSEFAVKVVDSYKDESKSEGQFAVVSFAYIGGILKLVADSASSSFFICLSYIIPIDIDSKKIL